uniref:S47A1 n=1 Tax=Poeciliopsis prolifica TaxID=188132 RepID=A0A0S7ENI4_9TELE
MLQTLNVLICKNYFAMESEYFNVNLFFRNIARIVSNLMTVYCFLQLFDGLVCVCTGIFLGTGKQRIPAVANFIAYYCVGLTMSVVLMFVAKLRISGESVK